jgi:hypothetical protein
MKPRLLSLFTALCCWLGATGPALAFPPAPSYTLFGLVRDQTGHTLTAEGAQLILFKGTTEVGRSPITSNLIDQSYELEIRIDQNRSGTSLYSEKALVSEGVFSLAVELNGTRFYPIEASGNLTAGKGSERVRLDLNLGQDSDRDGLPDVWEQWQLYQSGRFPDGNGNWDLGLIDRNGDLDGDGQNNFLEYVAGTFAGDATEKLDLQIKEKLDDKIRFEFYAITGKTYTIERTTDAKTWTRVPFSVGAALAADLSYTASGVAILSAFTAPQAGASKELFRLTVR